MPDLMQWQLIRERQALGVPREQILAELSGLGLTKEQLAHVDAKLQGKDASPEAALYRHLDRAPLYLAGVALLAAGTAIALEGVLARDAVVATLFVISALAGVVGFVLASLCGDPDEMEPVYTWQGVRWRRVYSAFSHPVRHWKVLFLMATALGLLILAYTMEPELVRKWLPRDRDRHHRWTRPVIMVCEPAVAPMSLAALALVRCRVG
jgi:hypothetical protein